MLSSEIARQRLYNQKLSAPTFSHAKDVVGWLGAVQAQDYSGALWAVGLRMESATESAVEQAFNAGAILRTHVLRPTWHFVLPADIRWMLALTAPRVRALLAYGDRQNGLDETVLTHSAQVIEAVLQGGQHLTRSELGAALAAAGIAPGSTQRLAHLLMHAELAGLICSGARQGNQQTYALIDERVPAAPALTHDEALAELTRRYFTSHAPATIKDFAWWSGLTVADAKQGMALNAEQFEHEEIDGIDYWFPSTTHEITSLPSNLPSAYLLPNYDEYVVAYTDRSAIYDPVHAQHLDARGNILFNHTVVLNGQIVGAWKRALKKGSLLVEMQLFTALTAEQTVLINEAAQRYADFLGLTLMIA